MNLKKTWLTILLMLIPILTIPAQADDRFLPVSSIRPGMKGIGYTVVSGDKIESFSVRVVGLLKGSASVRHFILVKVSGRIFGNSGGISAGMSGSPVFIDNKLIGAIGYGFQEADPTYGLVTPIEDMLRLWNYPDHIALHQDHFLFYEGGLGDYQGVAFLDKQPLKAGGGQFRSGSKDWLHAQAVATPLMVSGLGRRAFNHLYPLLAKGNLLPVYAGLTQGEENNGTGQVELKPGSAISVTLVDGDYEVKSLGTLTWIENGRFLAFGHPFLNRGLVEYGFGGAEVLDTITSSVFPFKIGSGYSPIGRVTQDRGAGISGQVGPLPGFIEVFVSVQEVGGKAQADYKFQVIKDEQLLPGLVLAGVMDAVDQRLDRIGPGTASVSFRIEGAEISPIKRENLFYGPDIAVVSLSELGRLLYLLAGNEFTQLDLTSVFVELEINPQRLSAKLIKSELPQEQFLPGEEFILTQKILPYRGTEVEVPMEIKLPSDLSPGKWMLSIHGAGYDTAAKGKNSEESLEETDSAFWETITSLDQLVTEFLSRPANNHLVVEAFPLDHGFEETGGDLEDEEFMDQSMPMPMEDSYLYEEEETETHLWTEKTAYFLTGAEQLIITILDPDAPQEFTSEEGDLTEEEDWTEEKAWTEEQEELEIETFEAVQG